MAQRAPGHRPVERLAPEERRELDAAHRRLREAALIYEPFIARQPLGPNDPPLHSLPEVTAAQDELLAAEDALWEIRSRLLGWERPESAQSITQVVDWILEDLPDEEQ
ncbi:MAG: hypothetical protein JJE05_05980 [Actinobacteria bacterium]|nr:hypothetical protein [Actinomycetota bacterium]